MSVNSTIMPAIPRVSSMRCSVRVVDGSSQIVLMAVKLGANSVVG